MDDKDKSDGLDSYSHVEICLSDGVKRLVPVEHIHEEVTHKCSKKLGDDFTLDKYDFIEIISHDGIRRFIATEYIGESETCGANDSLDDMRNFIKKMMKGGKLIAAKSRICIQTELFYG